MTSGRVTSDAIRGRKGQPPPIVMLTAYDTPTARIADAAGADVVLVGDSVAMVVLGHPDTLQLGIEEMSHHVAAVARARPRALIVADMPWLSYHLSPADAVANAGRLVRAGAEAVKIEGGRVRVPVVAALLDAQIPVMGHVGLTPQSQHVFGGYRVQGRDPAVAEAIVADARALDDAGCFALVVECVPRDVGALVTRSVSMPVVGIGAGPECDGQVLVLHDLLGLSAGPSPRFVRRYASLESDAVKAATAFVEDVQAGRFPSDDESYHSPGTPPPGTPPPDAR